MIQNPIIELLDNVDASQNQTSNGECLTLNYAWEVEVIKLGTDGNPILIIERSNDNVNWSNLVESCHGDLVLDDIVNSVSDDTFPMQYIRVKTLPNGTTTGTLKAKLKIKIRN
jgi:hypothetical protein